MSSLSNDIQILDYICKLISLKLANTFHETKRTFHLPFLDEEVSI